MPAGRATLLCLFFESQSIMKKSDISALNIAAPTLHMLVLVITHERKHPSDPPQMRKSLEALLALAGDLQKIAAKHLTELDQR